jgi:hypothetical protein
MGGWGVGVIFSGYFNIEGSEKSVKTHIIVKFYHFLSLPIGPDQKSETTIKDPDPPCQNSSRSVDKEAQDSHSARMTLTWGDTACR